MPVTGFAVTFERYDSPDDYDDCPEPVESGFMLENATLRDAVAECGDRASNAMDQDGNSQFLRAESREAAKAIICDKFEGARFFR